MYYKISDGLFCNTRTWVCFDSLVLNKVIIIKQLINIKLGETMYVFSDFIT